jgi:hypothetical protein
VRWIFSGENANGNTSNVPGFATVTEGTQITDSSGNTITVFESPPISETTIRNFANPVITAHVKNENNLTIHTSSLISDTGSVREAGVNTDGIVLSGQGTGELANNDPNYGIPSSTTAIRVFYSEDEDEDLDQIDASSIEDSIENPEIGQPRSTGDIRSSYEHEVGPWSTYLDMTYYTAGGLLEFDGYSIGEYRRNQLLHSPTNQRVSKVLDGYNAVIGENKPKDNGVVKDAYIAIVGVNNASKPTFTKGSGDYPLFMGSDGEVMTFMDYRLESNALPGGYRCCKSTYGSHPKDQYQTKFEYGVSSVEETQSASVAGERAGSVNHNGGAAIEYSDDSSKGPVEVSASGEIEAKVMQYEYQRQRSEYKVVNTREVCEYIDFTGPDAEPICYNVTDVDWRWGSWSGWDRVSTEVQRVDTVSMSDSTEGLITDNNDIEIKQTAVEVSETRYHTYVEIDYPGISGDTISGDELTQQYIWSMIKFGDGGTFVENDWKMFSQTEHKAAFIRDGKGAGAQRERIPNLLSVHLFSEDDGPTAVSGQNDEGVQSARLAGWGGYNVSVVGADSVPPDIKLESGKPVMYDEFWVRNAPSPATEVVSISGDTRQVESWETEIIPYAEPDVTITRESEALRIRVAGMNGEPLEGRNIQISVSSVNKGVHTTDSNGEVKVDVENAEVAHITVDVAGDDYETVQNQDTDVFYGAVSAQKTLGSADITGHLYRVVKSALFASPLIMLYLLWRDGRLGI